MYFLVVSNFFLRKVTKVTIEYQEWPKMGQKNSIKRPCFALKVGPHSMPYPLVFYKKSKHCLHFSMVPVPSPRGGGKHEIFIINVLSTKTSNYGIFLGGFAFPKLFFLGLPAKPGAICLFIRDEPTSRASCLVSKCHKMLVSVSVCV